jgi:hypothetical protein
VLLVFFAIEALRFLALGELDDEDSESFKADVGDDNANVSKRDGKNTLG